MPFASPWDVVLLVVAGVVAVGALARLMANRRNELAARFRADMERQRSRAATAQRGKPDKPGRS